MAGGKWGESFLKSGLPLEHLTQVTFRDLKWYCSPEFEYERSNRENETVWFELDLFATAPRRNQSTELAVLVECKYHDASRHWFFLPHADDGRWQFDDRVLNCGPYQTLTKPKADTLLDLAPLSSGGIVVSEDGAKQDNAVYTAVQQLANGFVPCALEHMFMYNIDFHNVRDPKDEVTFVPRVTGIVPMIVTNAKLYRLKPDVTNLEAIRSASTPADVADEVPWTWCYHDPNTSLWDQNQRAIGRHLKRYAELVYRFPTVEEAARDFGDRPNWMAIVNIAALKTAVGKLLGAFMKLDTIDVRELLKSGRQERRRLTRR